MSCTTYQPKRLRRTRPAFGLLEVVISTFIVGVLLVVALNGVGSATSGQAANGQRSRAHLLAQALMAEIFELHYREPDDAAVFGPESGEGTGGTRNGFDDVDDYHGWTASPPLEKDGTPLPDLAAWQRSASVDYVNPNIHGNVVGSDQGTKLVTVSVSRNGTTMATLRTIVTDAWQPPPYE